MAPVLETSRLELREVLLSAHPIGICGLVKRDFLAYPDLGFALLPEHGLRCRGCAAADVTCCREVGNRTPACDSKTGQPSIDPVA